MSDPSTAGTERPWSGTLRAKAGSIDALGLTGIAFGALAGAAALLVRRLPDWAASTPALRAWLDDPGNRSSLLAAEYLSVFSAIALLWFIAALRSRIGAREDRLFATVFFGSGLVYIAVHLAGYSALTIPATLYRHNAQSQALYALPASFALGSNLLTMIDPRISALMMLSLSNLGRITHALPRWLIALGTLCAVFLLIGMTFRVPIMWVFPAWTVAVGAVILWHRERIQHAQPRDG